MEDKLIGWTLQVPVRLAGYDGKKFAADQTAGVTVYQWHRHSHRQDSDQN